MDTNGSHHSLTPEELRQLLIAALDTFTADYLAGNATRPNYTHLEVGGQKFKVGYYPDVNDRHFKVNISCREPHHGN